ncbi:MAG: hypothetical protein ABFD07_04100 [Methanobacterium sp.]
MTNLDENNVLSILYSNSITKKRNVDLLTLSNYYDFLIKKYGNSRKAVADRLDISSEMIRNFLIAKDLPLEIQQLISERKIDSLDVVKQISEIKNKDEQIKVAYAILGLSTKDIRDIIRLIKKEKLNVDDAKKIILNEKPKKYHVYLIDIEDEDNSILLKEAEKEKIKPAEFVKKIILAWLEKKYDNGSNREEK